MLPRTWSHTPPLRGTFFLVLFLFLLGNQIVSTSSEGSDTDSLIVQDLSDERTTQNSLTTKDISWDGKVKRKKFEYDVPQKKKLLVASKVVKEQVSEGSTNDAAISKELSLSADDSSSQLSSLSPPSSSSFSSCSPSASDSTLSPEVLQIFFSQGHEITCADIDSSASSRTRILTSSASSSQSSSLSPSLPSTDLLLEDSDRASVSSAGLALHSGKGKDQSKPGDIGMRNEHEDIPDSSLHGSGKQQFLEKASLSPGIDSSTGQDSKEDDIYKKKSSSGSTSGDRPHRHETHNARVGNDVVRIEYHIQ